MTQIIIAALSLSVLGYLAYRTLYDTRGAGGEEAPQQRLQNVREAAQRLEDTQQRHVDEVDEKTRGE